MAHFMNASRHVVATTLAAPLVMVAAAVWVVLAVLEERPTREHR